jgi:glycine/D-amino acid oxidase-like deaminating enzyme
MERVFDQNRAAWLVGAAPDEPTMPLARDLAVDVAIIGGGFTGVSTAFHLSRRHPDLGVVLLEAVRLGNGASGRNGGLMLNGVTPTGDPEEIAVEHELTRRAMDDLEALIREHQLAVRYRRDGCLRLFTSPQAAEAGHAEVEGLASRGLPLRFLTASELDSVLRIRGVAGAVLDPGEGLLNGIDLIRAMRPLLTAQGVMIHEGTPVTAIQEGQVVELSTPRAVVRARAIVLATNGYTPRLGYFRTGILPVISHVIATCPLSPELLRETGLGGVAGFSDDRPRLAYASVDLDGRLLFGGGTTAAYGYRFGNATVFEAAAGDRAARALCRSMSEYVPGLADIEVCHRWSGPLGLTLARHSAMGVFGEHDNIYYALGYSGHGVLLANLAGTVIADLYAGNHDPWRRYAFYMARPSGIPPEPLRWLGYQLYTKLTGRSPWKRTRSAS